MDQAYERGALSMQALDDAERSIKLHGLLGSYEPHSLVSMFAQLLCAKSTEDDTDPLRALTFVMELLLDDQSPSLEPEYDEHENVVGHVRISKAKMLSRAVRALESVVGRRFQIEPTISERLVNLNEAGERSAVRPEDVPPELRGYTVSFWQTKQAQMSEQHPLLQLTDEHDAKAAQLVAEAREAGAFLLPFDEMPRRQQDFWRQRAMGFEHKP